jgi:hypothetical protein
MDAGVPGRRDNGLNGGERLGGDTHIGLRGREEEAMRTLTAFACAALLLGLVASAGATIWHVPGQCLTIQAGIDSAATGDTVLVADGTYAGLGNYNIDFLGKAILVTSENGPEATIIDCEEISGHRAFVFQSGETPSSVLRGFTVKYGSAETGGNILCMNSSPTIEGNVITTGLAWPGLGGGIYCSGASSSPLIVDNFFELNYGDLGGGIACVDTCAPTISGNVFKSNNSIFGGGVGCESWSSPAIMSCTFTTNGASSAGGAIWTFSSGSPTVTNSILWSNWAPNGPQIWVQGGNLVVSYSDVEGGWAGVGNILEDPLFVAGPLGDYYLSQTEAGQPEQSPCVDAGDPGSAVPSAKTTRTDREPDVSPIDMGYHYPSNRGPDLVDEPDTLVAENEYLTFTLEANDPDGDSMAFSSPDLPSGATLDEVSGLFEWTPDYAQAGLHTITFIAADFATPAMADTEQTDITVLDVNRSPDLLDQPDTTVAEEEYLTFTLVADDPDGDSVAYSSPDLPAGATLGEATGVFEWTPTGLQSGLYTVMFIATDFGVPALADTEQTDITVTDAVGVDDGDEELRIPRTRYLAQNRPNPFRSSTTIQFGLVAPTHVRLAIYDVRGALVRRLAHGELPAGHHGAAWDGRDGQGHCVGSGIYFCRLEAGDITETRRMVILR